MSTIQHVKLEHFRNFKSYELEFTPAINIIIGENGSGKTSILEAVHFLAYGKSFRAKELNRMVQQGEKSFTLFLKSHPGALPFQIGMQRSNQESINRLNGETPKNLSEMAEVLPLLLLHPESFQFLTGSAKMRRQLMDWGVFYHYPESRAHFTLLRKALKQRNQALKQQAAREHVKLWETTIYPSCEILDRLRQEYTERLMKQTLHFLGEFAQSHQLAMEYDRGWPENEALSEVWERSFVQDLRSGYTEYGPHQADLKITSRKKPAKDMLSRGQQKTLICMLKLAQGLIFEDFTQRKPIYLFDDLASELDQTHRQQLYEQILAQQSQVIVTSVQKDPIFTGQEIHLQ